MCSEKDRATIFTDKKNFVESGCVVTLARDGPTYGKADRNKGKCSPYSITELKVPELIPVLCSQPTADVSHKPGGRLPLHTARPLGLAFTLATLKRAATNFAAW